MLRFSRAGGFDLAFSGTIGSSPRFGVSASAQPQPCTLGFGLLTLAAAPRRGWAGRWFCIISLLQLCLFVLGSGRAGVFGLDSPVFGSTPRCGVQAAAQLLFCILGFGLHTLATAPRRACTGHWFCMVPAWPPVSGFGSAGVLGLASTAAFTSCFGFPAPAFSKHCAIGFGLHTLAVAPW